VVVYHYKKAGRWVVRRVIVPVVREISRWRVKVEIHKPHHKWGGQRYWYVHCLFYKEGVKGSDVRVQIPIWPGPE